MPAEFNFRYDSSIVCTAIHNGHELCTAVQKNLAVSNEIQLYEEDPFTENFTKICNNRIVATTSRFEIDLNRNSEKCIYLEPADAWGLQTRIKPPSAEIITASKKKYFEFYRKTEEYLRKMEAKFGKFFVWDIHSYNHHRLGTNAPFDDPQKNPDIMLGLNNMDPSWYFLVEKIKNTFDEHDFFGRKLAVTTNGKFPGGNFSRWIHNTFPSSACCIAIEFKKIFMDEWTGVLFPEKQQKLIEILASVNGLIISELPEI